VGKKITNFLTNNKNIRLFKANKLSGNLNICVFNGKGSHPRISHNNNRKTTAKQTNDVPKMKIEKRFPRITFFDNTILYIMLSKTKELKWE